MSGSRVVSLDQFAGVRCVGELGEWKDGRMAGVLDMEGGFRL